MSRRTGFQDPELRFSRATRWGEPSSHRPDLGPCLIYLGADNGNGYGQFSYRGKNGYAHRYAWERVHGPIPDDLTVDHLCRVRRCVNVEHMELTDRLDNYLRGVASRKFCPNGHPYIEENLVVKDGRPGVRFCRKCRDETARRTGLRRTKAAKGEASARNRYDLAERDRLVVAAVDGELSVQDAAGQLGCSVKYMDKLVRREARARGITNRRKVKGASFDGWTEFKTRVAVRERSNGVCERCDKAVATDMHHRKNRSQMGQWNPCNIVHLCALCHVEITAEPEASRRSGFSVLSTDDPETVPVVYRSQRCLLEDDGSVVVVSSLREVLLAAVEAGADVDDLADANPVVPRAFWDELCEPLAEVAEARDVISEAEKRMFDAQESGARVVERWFGVA